MFSPLDDITHVIQTALTPVFLLSAIAALLNVFATRLARVADQVDRLTQGGSEAGAASSSAQLAFLRRRTQLLDAAVVLGAGGAGLTCFAALFLFVGSLRETSVAFALFAAFGLALLTTIGALIAFVGEMLMSSRGLRAKVAVQQAK